jgi:L-alanine-DL-glutamate epimerase-like enolase superfamily enzyme
MAHAFEDYQVGWFEEPVLADDIDGLAAVAHASRIPIATGEHEYTKYGFKDLIVRGGADIVQPDAGRVGGVTEWMKAATLAHAFNLPVAPHAFQLVSLHLGCATPNLRIVEYLGTAEQGDRLWYTDFPQPKDGWWAPYPDRPGLGLELNSQAVAQYAV